VLIAKPEEKQLTPEKTDSPKNIGKSPGADFSRARSTPGHLKSVKSH